MFHDKYILLGCGCVDADEDPFARLSLKGKFLILGTTRIQTHQSVNNKSNIQIVVNLSI